MAANSDVQEEDDYMSNCFLESAPPAPKAFALHVRCACLNDAKFTGGSKAGVAGMEEKGAIGREALKAPAKPEGLVHVDCVIGLICRTMRRRES